jgi:hypothetical protein
LNRRLDFIEWFYLAASRPFEALQRQCIAPDASRDDDRGEWEKATRGLEVLGQCSLGLLAKALHDYVLELTRSMGGSGPKQKKGSWLQHLSEFLEGNTSFRWTHSPVSYDKIEQIVMTRNDCVHYADVMPEGGFQAKQTNAHAKSHPSSRFIDPVEKAIRTAMSELQARDEFEEARRAAAEILGGGFEEEALAAPASLTVSRTALQSAVNDVREFCAFLGARVKETQ